MAATNNTFVQVGLVVLMGLACKNAILIVEFARETRIPGQGIVEAALEACRLRLRPIVMTFGSLHRRYDPASALARAPVPRCARRLASPCSAGMIGGHPVRPVS